MSLKSLDFTIEGRPVSVNHLYFSPKNAKLGTRVLTDDGKIWKAKVAGLFLEQFGQMGMNKKLAVIVEYIFPVR